MPRKYLPGLKVGGRVSVGIGLENTAPALSAAASKSPSHVAPSIDGWGDTKKRYRHQPQRRSSPVARGPFWLQGCRISVPLCRKKGLAVRLCEFHPIALPDQGTPANDVVEFSPPRRRTPNATKHPPSTNCPGWLDVRVFSTRGHRSARHVLDQGPESRALESGTVRG
jgi:hypothetical protein